MAKNPFGKNPAGKGGMPLTPGKSPFASAPAARMGLTGGPKPALKSRMAPPAAAMPTKAKPAGMNPFAPVAPKRGKKPPMAGY
jgi:hypothetical protein